MPNALELLKANVDARMEDLGIQNYKDVAKKIGVSPGQLSIWFSAKKTPGLPILDKLSEALKTTPAMLLSDPARDKLVPTEPSIVECLDRVMELVADLRAGKADSPLVKRLFSEARNKKK